MLPQVLLAAALADGGAWNRCRWVTRIRILSLSRMTRAARPDVRWVTRIRILSLSQMTRAARPDVRW
eukprot:3541344-Prymnesium_polylepis.1